MTNIEKLNRIMEIFSSKIVALNEVPKAECSAEWFYRKAKREQLLEDLGVVEKIIGEK